MKSKIRFVFPLIIVLLAHVPKKCHFHLFQVFGPFPYLNLQEKYDVDLTMGDKKVVIYVPQEYHKDILKDFKGKPLKITTEEAI